MARGRGLEPLSPVSAREDEQAAERRPTVGRRGILLGGVGLASAAAAGGVALLRRRGGPGGDLTEVRPAHSDELVEAFGVGVHLNFRQSTYGDTDSVLRFVKRLGARHVRTRLSPRPDVLDAFEKFSRRGVSIQGVCGAFGEDESMASLLDQVAARFPDPNRIFSAFEGINEPNKPGVPWIAETRGKTEELFLARESRGLGRIPIVAPALARLRSGGVEGRDTYEQAGNLGDLSSWVDYGNMHVYPVGLQPSTGIAYYRAAAERVCGEKPVMCTEGGYFTALNYQGPSKPVAPDVLAAYGPQLLLEHWRARTARFFRYELFDDLGFNDTDREATFGIVEWRDDGAAGVPVPKPEFEAVRRLLAVCADPGPAYQPPLTRIGVGGPDDVGWLVFARRDGTLLVTLWLDRPVWDPDARAPLVGLAEPLDEVDVGWAAPRDVEIESLSGAAPRRRLTARRSVRLALPAGVTLLTIHDA